MRGPVDEFGLAPARTALVVVDMQVVFGPGGPWIEYYRAAGQPEGDLYETRLSTLLPALKVLIRGCQEAGSQVVFLRVGRPVGKAGPPRMARLGRAAAAAGRPMPSARPGDLAYEILPELEPQAGDWIVDKTTANVFASTDLERRLRDKGIDTLVFAGVGTNYCVESSLRGAYDLGFECVLAEDACGAWTPEAHDTALASMRTFCRIDPVERVLEDLREGP
ncbi:MAG: cysteine hydrolase [Chloroflexi bacterium]|nr:cysteine hydrolase [Chloroflexota bacterium]